MATSIGSAICQWHMFSADRNEVQTNAADENLDLHSVSVLADGIIQYNF